VGCALALVLIPLGEKSTGMVLWPVFATTNQILACLALLIVSVYLRRQGKPIIYTLLPVFFMLIITSWAMGLNLVSWTGNGIWMLSVAGAIIFVAQLWFVVEGLCTVARRKAVASG
jgi:carbon starvation protein